MYIQEVTAGNFGPLESIRISLPAVGTHVIEGQNEAGKTQLAGAILAAIIGRPALRFDQGGKSPSSITIVLAEDDYAERVSVMATSTSGGHAHVTQNVETLTNNTIKRHLNLDLLSTMSDTSSPNLLLDLGGAETIEFSESDIHQLDEQVPESLRNSPVWSYLREDVLHQVTHSRSAQQMAQLLREFSVRQGTAARIPLLVDGGIGQFDEQWQNFAFELIAEVARSTQVLLFTDRKVVPIGSVVASLDNRAPSQVNFASYNTALAPHKIRPVAKSTAKYRLHQRYPSPENRFCEFKEVKGHNPVGAIKNVVDEYVVAYLNAGERQDGRIIWGVKNEDFTVVGVRLSDMACDELRRVVTEKLHQIVPPIAPTAYRITLHPISDEVRAIPELYLVEVTVPSSRRTLLFATGSQEVYVKTDAGKKKLTVVEIQQELLRRCGIDG